MEPRSRPKRVRHRGAATPRLQPIVPSQSCAQAPGSQPASALQVQCANFHRHRKGQPAAHRAESTPATSGRQCQKLSVRPPPPSQSGELWAELVKLYSRGQVTCHWGGPVACTDHSQAQNQYTKSTFPHRDACESLRTENSHGLGGRAGDPVKESPELSPHPAECQAPLPSPTDMMLTSD